MKRTDVGVPRSVRIGGTTKHALLAELQARGVQLNEMARAIFAHQDFATSAAPAVIETMEVCVGDLGRADGATIAEVFASAVKHGLSLCPLELAPHLRLQFMEQPEGYLGHPSSKHRAPPGSLTIASQPLATDDGDLMGFYLRRIRGVLWLRGYRSPAEHVWSADDRFVFCRSGRATRA
jgi:hypothetical protein